MWTHCVEISSGSFGVFYECFFQFECYKLNRWASVPSNPSVSLISIGVSVTPVVLTSTVDLCKMIKSFWLFWYDLSRSLSAKFQLHHGGLNIFELAEPVVENDHKKQFPLSRAITHHHLRWLLRQKLAALYVFFPGVPTGVNISNNGKTMWTRAMGVWRILRVFLSLCLPLALGHVTGFSGCYAGILPLQCVRCCKARTLFRFYQGISA